MAYEPGDPIRLTRPVPRIGGELPAGFRMTVEDAWHDRSGRELVNAQAGSVGVSCLPADAIERADLPTQPATAAGPFEALTAAGWTVSPKAFEPSCHVVTRGKVRGHFDLETGRLTIWGAKTVLALDEACGEFTPQPPAVVTEPVASDETEAEPTVSLTPEQQAWLDRCVAAGFEIVDGPRPPAANCGATYRGATYRGETYALLPWTREIVDRRFEKHRLTKFEAPREIAVTGRTAQRSLLEVA